MLKPNNYDNTPVIGDWKPLAAGGYICKIMSVEEVVSNNGRDMLRVCFDIAEGPEKDRFAKEWKSNTQQVKYWSGVSFVFVHDYDSPKDTAKAFKTFITAIENSNKITINWVADADKFAAQFKNKAVGVIFGREEYLKSDGKTTAWKTAAKFFRSVESIRNNDFVIPADKPLSDNKPKPYSSPPQDIGFEPLPVDDDLPF